MIEASTRSLKFADLFRAATSEWPRSVRLERLPATEGGYLVQGLVDQGEEIADRHIDAPDEVLLRSLHWAIVVALHDAAKANLEVQPSKLAMEGVRQPFEEQLIDARDRKALGWTENDRALIARYFRENARP